MKLRIPQAFIDKMEVDRDLDTLRKDDVIDFTVGKSLVIMQRVYRSQCRNILNKKRPAPSPSISS